MSKAARIRYLADWDYVDKKATEFSLTQEVIEKLDSIEPSAEKNAIQGIKVNWQLQEPDQYRVVSLAIPEVEDNLDSISSTNALSAKQGRVLYNRIKNLEGLGKFLSNWDSTTWMPTTNPQAIPYEYHSWDYYIVGRVGATNYRPDWTSYRWIPSTVVESEEVKVWDFYFFNWATWELLLNTDRQIPIDESLSTTSTNPVENRVVTAALNLKANDADISVVGKTNDFNDLDNIPDIPDSLDDLTGTSDDIAEWTSHLFLTSAERWKLAQTSGVNTWDETNASIMSKLGAASSTTNGYLTVADWNTFNNKQASISDLETIRSNASAWKNASDTIATYGDVVTHDANEFATATQGWKADTALQSWDNVSELTNDAWYVTDAYHDSTKQDKLIAWANIQIAADWKTISATDTTYVAWDFDIKDLADSTGLRAEWSWKQDALTAWSNIQISGSTISATDTTYSAWPGISISANNVISANDNKATWWSIEWTLSNQTDLQSALDNKQDALTAWANIQIAQDGTISATDTTYTAGTWIDITNWVISNTQTSAEWWNIQWDITDQTDLQSALGDKQNTLTAGANIQITGDTISATDTTYTASDFDIKDLADSTGKRASWDAKQDAISDLATIRSNASTAIQPNDNVSELVNDAGYITSADIPTLDTAMSATSTNGVQNKVIKSYVDTQVQEATAGAVSDTAYWSSWDWVTGIAPSKNAVYDKLNAMDTTIAWKQNIISDLSTIRSWASKWATAVQPWDNISTLNNDSGFITKAVSDLTNYYTKSEVYTKAEVADYVANFSWFDVVATLPTTDIKTTVIYLLWPVGTWADKYEEYIYSNNTWIKIWDTSIDLSPYFNKNSDTSDAITEWSTNLFLTTAERTKLSNTSGTNTGDETKATIQSKLWAASSSASGYLTSTDWNTFNNKLWTSAISDTAYWSWWDADTIHAPSKNAVYDKISAMDTTIWSKADDSDVVHLSWAETIIDWLKVFESNDDPTPNSWSVTTSLTLKWKNLKKWWTAWYKYTSIDFKDQDDALIAKFSGLTTPDWWSGFMAWAWTDPTSTSWNLWLIADNATNSKLFLIPPTTWHNYWAVRYDYYNNNTVRLSTNQTIAWTKTFSTSPVVPSKTADATNSGTAIATEAQVYKKQDTISDLETIRTGAWKWTTAVQPGDSLSELTWTSDDITQWTTNLFLTSVERTKLSNTSWTNTGDETKTTIQNKLWAASSSNNWYLSSTNWNTFNGKMPWFSLNISHATSGVPREVKFVTINYWNMTQYWAAYFRLSAASCHPDWWWYNYMVDIYIWCTYQWVVKCDIIKYIQSSIDKYNPDYEWWWKYFGDVFYVVDTDAKKVYFYILWWQYTSSDFTPAVKIWSTSLENVQQHSWTWTYYDTWTKVWANGCWSLVAIKSDIPSKTSQLTNDSGFITSASLPTVNNWTLTINQGWTSKWTFTANQSSASTVNLETWKLVTQTEYNNISWASSDWNLYIIYKTV